MPAPGRTAAPDLLPLALGALAGASILFALPALPPRGVVVLAAAAAVVVSLALGHRLQFPRLMLLGFVAGGTCAFLSATQRLDTRLDAALHGQDQWLTGTVSSLVERAGDTLHFLFETDEGPARRLRVSWYRTHAAVRGGDCMRLLLRLRHPHGSMNPGASDYEGWLFREGISATAYVRDAQPCAMAPGPSLLRLRQELVDEVSRALSGDAFTGYVQGLTLGDESAISDAQWQVLRRTGTTHLLSVSGLHVALAAAFVFLLVRWLWSSIPSLTRKVAAQRVAAIGAGLAGAAYSLLAGMSIPTQRSLVMLLLVLCAAWWWQRPVKAAQVLACATLGVLVADPVAVLFPGFWLSFGAVAWIAYVMTGRLAPPSGWKAAVGVQLSLSLALIPACLHWFGEASLVSPVANLVLIPVFSVLLPWLLLGVAMLHALPAAGAWMLHAGCEVLALGQLGLEWLAALPHAYWTWPSPGVTATFLAIAGFTLCFMPAGLPGRPLAALFCLPMLLHTSEPPPYGAFDVTALDVGQGLSVVVRTSSHAMLFDAGPASPGGFDAGQGIVVPYLRHEGISRLDMLLLSHTDMDHRGGISAVRAAIPVAREIGTEHGSVCRAGEGWRWDGVDFEVLHPAGDSWSDNNGSCVLRVVTGGHAVLLTGDIESEAETALLESNTDRLRADVLTVPHHGSATSSTDGFLAAAQPRDAIVSAGWRNRWHFPRADVVSRYRDIGATLHDTGTDGAVLMRVDPARGVIGLRHWRKEGRRVWTSTAAD